MKGVVCILVALFTGCVISAQECIFFAPFDAGHVLVYNNYSPRGKLLSTTRKTLVNSEQTSTGAVLTFRTVETSTMGHILLDNTSKMVCENGRFYIDMKNYLNKEMMSFNDEYTLTYDINDLIELPFDMEVGEMLPSGKVVVTANTGKKPVDHSLEVKYRQVEGAEEVQTPAGKYKCFKITFLMETDAGKHTEVLVSEWVAVGVGVVKREVYNTKGKLLMISELNAESFRLASR